MRRLYLLQALNRIGMLLSVDARMAILAEQDQIAVTVPLFKSHFWRRARSAIARRGYVSDLPNNHHWIIFC
jgi:hypothetical protein